MPAVSPAELSAVVKTAAAEAGLGLCGITRADAAETFPAFEEWLDAGMAGEMGYLPGRREARRHPASVMHAVRSVVMVGLDYRTQEPAESRPGYGRVSRYAWGRGDYHDVMRAKLKAVAAALHEAAPGLKTRAAVDTAPLLERDFARAAGLGWFGKNTMLISKRRGSFLLLGALLTDADLTPDERHETDHCGTCTACLEACPTDAFPRPGVLDARRCISYLTIELRGRPIPDEFVGRTDDWVFGCDVCQDVCPWNTKSVVSGEPAFQWQGDAETPGLVPLAELRSMSEADFQTRYAGTPVERTGVDAMRRNADLAAAAGADPATLPP